MERLAGLLESTMLKASQLDRHVEDQMVSALQGGSFAGFALALKLRQGRKVQNTQNQARENRPSVLGKDLVIGVRHDALTTCFPGVE